VFIFYRTRCRREIGDGDQDMVEVDRV
jgi:hypothetical protein